MARREHAQCTADSLAAAQKEKTALGGACLQHLIGSAAA
jgi:hypothetical protein